MRICSTSPFFLSFCVLLWWWLNLGRLAQRVCPLSSWWRRLLRLRSCMLPAVPGLILAVCSSWNAWALSCSLHMNQGEVLDSPLPQWLALFVILRQRKKKRWRECLRLPSLANSSIGWWDIDLIQWGCIVKPKRLLTPPFGEYYQSPRKIFKFARPASEPPKWKVSCME